MGRIYLIRHGETEWNKEQRSQGCSNNIPLSEIGMKQAKAAAERLRDVKIDRIFSSTLLRAHQTAEEIAKYHDLQVEDCSEFIEINFGSWEGMRFPDIKAQYNEIYNSWRLTPHLAEIPGAEKIEDLRNRSMNKIYKLMEKYPDDNILVVSHGISIKVIITAMMGMDLGKLHRIRQDNAAINIFDYDRINDSFDVISLNDICHLKGVIDFDRGSFEMK